MKNILLSIEYSELVQYIFISLVIILGVIWYVIKTPEKVVKKENNITNNIQSINRMGYRPEEDDEITGYEYAEKPYIEIYGYRSTLTGMIFENPPYNENDTFIPVYKNRNPIKNSGHINEHVNSVINKN